MKLTRPAGIGSLGLLAAIVACSSSESDEGTGSSADTCSELPPLTITADTKLGFVQIYEASGLWRTANTNSIVGEAEKRGYDLTYKPGTTDAAKEQASRFRDVIDAKVHAIIVAPHDEATISPLVVTARKACIPVFIEDRSVDTDVAIPGEDYVTLVGSDMVEEGRMAAEELIARSGGKAKVLVFEGTVGSGAAVGRQEGFDELIADELGIEVLVSSSADFDVEKGYDVAMRLLPKYPEADWIFSHNDGMSFGIIKALEELGKVPGEDVRIVSIDGTKQAAEYVATGKIEVIIQCNPHHGPALFDAIEDYAAGKKVPTLIMDEDIVIDSSNIEEYMPLAF